MEEEDSSSRKRKLEQIRLNAAKQKQQGQETTSEKKIKFRNYQPYDAGLKKSEDSIRKEYDEKKSSAADAVGRSPSTEITESISNVAQKATQMAPLTAKELIQQELQRHESSDELNLVPKKPNWDLKQQVSERLDKLKARTQRAIVEILREKLTSAEEIDE